MSKRSVLITGSSGFIGSHLVNALSSSEYSVYSMSKGSGHDVCKQEAFDDFMDPGIDMVVHLAGESFVPDSWNRPGDFFSVNTLGTQCVLNFCKKVSAKLVYISAYIYGSPQYLPIDENHPVLPNNPYAHSKWLGEELCKFYAREMGVKSLILRPFNIYGKGQDERYLIPILIKQLNEKGRVEVKDDIPRRDYLHVYDFIKACILAMSYNGNFDIFNVGGGGSFSVREVIEVMAKCRGSKIEWRSLGEKRRNEIMDTVADCRRIKDALGWAPRVSFEEGIRAMMGPQPAEKKK